VFSLTTISYFVPNSTKLKLRHVFVLEVIFVILNKTEKQKKLCELFRHEAQEIFNAEADLCAAYIVLVRLDDRSRYSDLANSGLLET
jgi:predicted Rossmann-fold nucleotide-binding protein